MQLLEYIHIAIIAETSAVLALLYFVCIGEDMILDFIGRWLNKENNYNEFVDKFNYTKDDSVKPIQKIDIPKWKKPLGLCQPCTVVWVAIITIIIFIFCKPLFFAISAVSNAHYFFRKFI